MIDYIEENYINQGRYFSDGHFQTLTFEAYDNIYHDIENPPAFQCSSSFIYKFKEKYNISLRLAHFKQRDQISDIIQDPIQIDTFKATIRYIIEDVRQRNEIVLNPDETGFRIFPNYIKTWAYNGSKNIAINVVDSTKERISVMATISSNYEKLPLFFITSANQLFQKKIFFKFLVIILLQHINY